MLYRTGSMTSHSINVARLQVTRWLEVGTAQGGSSSEVGFEPRAVQNWERRSQECRVVLLKPVL